MKVALSYGPNLTITVIDDLIKHSAVKLMQILKSNEDLSVMYSLFKKSPIRGLLQSQKMVVDKVCFVKGLPVIFLI